MRSGLAIIGVLASGALAAPSSAQQLGAPSGANTAPSALAADGIVDPWHHAESRGAGAAESIVDPWQAVAPAVAMVPVTSGLPIARERSVAISPALAAPPSAPSAPPSALDRWTPAMVDALIDPWATRSQASGVNTSVLARSSWASANVEVIDPWADRGSPLTHEAGLLSPGAAERGFEAPARGGFSGHAAAPSRAVRAREPIF